MSDDERRGRAWFNAILLIINFLLLTAFSLYVGAVQGTPLVISVAERCLPIGIAGKNGGVEIYTRNVKRLTVPNVCAGNPPARLWRDGNDRAVTCGNEPNPLGLNTKVETVQFVRLGKC
jgi:hypothetical protein